jgi:hypothetical protein
MIEPGERLQRFLVDSDVKKKPITITKPNLKTLQYYHTHTHTHFAIAIMMNNNPNNPNAVLDLLANTTAIEKSSVVKGTRENYVNKLILIIIWFFDERKNLLTNSCINQLNIADATDKALPTAIKRKKRQNMRSKIRSLIRNLDRNNSETSPIKLTAVGRRGTCLQYEDIADYMATKQKVELVNRASAIQFQKTVRDISGSIDAEVADDEELIMDDVEDENGDVRVAIRLDPATYEGIRSAVAYLYRESGVLMPEEMNSRLSVYIKGSRRMNLLAKQMLGLKLSEGKKHMTKKVYRYLAQVLFESEDPAHIFGHLFFILDWYVLDGI